MNEVKNIPIEKIGVSSLNPRKLNIEDNLQELTDSIRSLGVIQPIVVRTIEGNKNFFEIVCGSRRLAAAKRAELGFIPAVVRTLTDTEALELMITENLQRKDIHPMEEAEAMALLVSKHNYDVASLVAKFGKSEMYIRIRLKLNEMIEPFKELLFQDVITIGIAESVSRLQKEIQQEIFSKNFDQRGLYWQCPSVKQLKETIARNYTGDLSDVTFDLADETLIPAAGACTVCPKNTATNAIIFSEFTNVTGTCTDRACLTLKKSTAFEKEVKRIQDEDPAIVLGFPQSIYGEDRIAVNAQIKEGLPAIEISYKTGFEEIEVPDKPELPEKPEKKDFDDPDEYKDALDEYKDEKARFKDDLKNYESYLAQYEKDLIDPSVRKVFMVAGNDKGKYVFCKQTVKEDGGVEGTTLPEVMKSGNDVAIHTKIKEMEAKDHRNGELAFEKINEDVRNFIGEDYENKDIPLTTEELFALNVIMLDEANEDLRKDLGSKGSWRIDNKEKLNFARTLTPEQQNRLMRCYIRKKLDTASPLFNFSEATSLIVISREFYPKETYLIEDKHNAVTLKRRVKIESNIAELKALLVKDPPTKVVSDAPVKKASKKTKEAIDPVQEEA